MIAIHHLWTIIYFSRFRERVSRLTAPLVTPSRHAGLSLSRGPSRERRASLVRSLPLNRTARVRERSPRKGADIPSGVPCDLQRAAKPQETMNSASVIEMLDGDARSFEPARIG